MAAKKYFIIFIRYCDREWSMVNGELTREFSDPLLTRQPPQLCCTHFTIVINPALTYLSLLGYFIPSTLFLFCIASICHAIGILLQWLTVVPAIHASLGEPLPSSFEVFKCALPP